MQKLTFNDSSAKSTTRSSKNGVAHLLSSGWEFFKTNKKWETPLLKNLNMVLRIWMLLYLHGKLCLYNNNRIRFQHKLGIYLYYEDTIIIRGVTFLTPAGKRIERAQLAGIKGIPFPQKGHFKTCSVLLHQYKIYFSFQKHVMRWSL